MNAIFPDLNIFLHFQLFCLEIQSKALSGYQ